MRKREFEKLLKQAIIEEAEEQGAVFEASPETEPIPETAQARFDAALNGKRRPNRSVFTRLRYFAYRNGRRLAFGAIAAGTVAALVLVVGLLTRTVLNGEKGESAPENSDHASTNAPVRTSEPGPLETNEPEGTTEPSSVDALVGTWMLEAVENEDESQSGQIAVINAMIAAGKYEATYTFLSDGNGLAYWDIEGEKTAQAFTYVVDGDKLTFSGETMTFEIDGDRMKLRESDLTMLFKRKEEGAAEETNDPSEGKTTVYPWQGYDCLIPEGFIVAYASADELICQTSEMNDQDMFMLTYELKRGEDLAGWDSDVFSEAHLKTLIGTFGVPTSQYADFEGYSSRAVRDGIVCYYLYNRAQKLYVGVAKVSSDDNTDLILVGMTLGEHGIDEFESVVKQFVMMEGDFKPDDTGVINNKYGNSKVFSDDGYQITLTEQFTEQKSEMGFDGYYTSNFGAVMIKIEPFTLQKGWENETVEEYLAAVIKNNRSDAQPEERDGFVFYRYKRDGMCGWNFAFKGSDAFYLVQFLCRESDESALTDLFFTFAGSMTVD